MLLAEITEAAVTGGTVGVPLLVYVVLDRMGMLPRKGPGASTTNGAVPKSRTTLIEEGRRMEAQETWQVGVTDSLKSQTGLLERIKDEIVRLNANLRRD